MDSPDRRRSPRLAFQQPARFTLLGPDVAADESFPARVVDVSAEGLRLETDRPLATDAALRIDHDDALLLAEVRYCEPAGEGRYVAGVRLRECFRHTEQLRRLLDELQQAAGGPPLRRSTKEEANPPYRLG